jgi:hypothetical protein
MACRVLWFVNPFTPVLQQQLSLNPWYKRTGLYDLTSKNI